MKTSSCNYYLQMGDTGRQDRTQELQEAHVKSRYARPASAPPTRVPFPRVLEYLSRQNLQGALVFTFFPAHLFTSLDSAQEHAPCSGKPPPGPQQTRHIHAGAADDRAHKSQPRMGPHSSKHSGMGHWEQPGGRMRVLRFRKNGQLPLTLTKIL